MYIDTDDILDASIYDPDNIAINTIFPRILLAPVNSAYKSKMFTGGLESMAKRLRRVILNLFSRGAISVQVTIIPYFGDPDTTNYYTADDRMENLNYDSLSEITIQTFTFPPTIKSYDPLTAVTTNGTGSNIVQMTPKTFEQLLGLDKYNDFFGKPVKVSVEVSTNLHTQLNSIILYARFEYYLRKAKR
jgi:hypothetical protein